VRVPCPKSLIGKWVVTESFGTHGAYDIVSGDIFFDTKNHAKLYLEDLIQDEFVRNHYSICQMREDYPYIQIRLCTCGISEKKFKMMKRKKNKDVKS
jgi:hypothetical protein